MKKRTSFPARRIPSKSKPNDRRRGSSLKPLIDHAVVAIHSKSRELMRQGPCTGEAEHLELLETIYRSVRLFGGDPDGEVADALASWLGVDASTNLFELLIRASIPRVPKSVTKIWVGALSYAAEFGVRPEKLRGFIWIKGGLVKCGEVDPTERREEVARWQRDREQRRRAADWSGRSS